MVKKINKDALMIKELISKGLRQCEISRLLGIKKEKVSYWVRHELKEIQGSDSGSAPLPASFPPEEAEASHSQ